MKITCNKSIHATTWTPAHDKARDGSRKDNIENKGYRLKSGSIYIYISSFIWISDLENFYEY